MENVDWNEVLKLIEMMYQSSQRLGAIFGRKFTLDGHLVGSIGEVIAAYMFDLELTRASNKGHDAHTRDKRPVEIKFTMGNTGVGLRSPPTHLIVMQRPNGQKVSVVYNGPGELVWAKTRPGSSNGHHVISLSALRTLNKSVAKADRLLLVREAPF